MVDSSKEDKHERTHVKNKNVFAKTADQGRCASARMRQGWALWWQKGPNRGTMRGHPQKMKLLLPRRVKLLSASVSQSDDTREKKHLDNKLSTQRMEALMAQAWPCMVWMVHTAELKLSSTELNQHTCCTHAHCMPHASWWHCRARHWSLWAGVIK